MVKKTVTTALFYLPPSGYICLLKFIFVCLILCLSTPAQAGFLDNLLSQVKVSVSTGQNGYSASQAGQQQEVQSLDFVKLEKGVYGVPFKADLATVLKWCVENNVNIQNPTRDQVEDEARGLLRKIKHIKDDYETDKFFESEAEKDLAEITTDKEMDDLDKYFAQNAEQMLQTLKNPSVDYGGVIHILTKDFSAGVQCVVGGVNRLCNDKGITDSVYSLTVTPSQQSQNLLNQGLNTIKINFFNDGSGKLLSYASIASFSFDARDDSEKQYQILNGVLSQKYGEATKSINIMLSLKGFYPYLFWPEITSRMEGGPTMWKENIFILRGQQTFSVYYFDPDIAGEASAAQVQTVQRIDQAMANADANKVKVIQNNF